MKTGFCHSRVCHTLADKFLWHCFPLSWLLLASLAQAGTQPGIEPVIFAAYGDMPYMVKLPDGRTDEEVLLQDIAPKIRNNANIPFVIHVGDLGKPQYACSDAWLEKTKSFWQQELRKPVFYTPGDNDWTDCDRKKLQEPKSELARLDAIRRIFFKQPMTLAADWRYEQQRSLPENQTWQYRGIRFVTQHIVNSDNGRREILLDDPQHALQLVEQRDRENKIWLDHAFDLARNPETRAVVVAMQVDPFGPPDGDRDAMARCIGKLAYGSFCQHLESLASSLDKPVLLVHGDTNAYCLDQPFDRVKVPKLWRLNTPGDFKVIDAALIAFDPANNIHPFGVTGVLSGNPAPQTCDYSR